MDLMHKIAQKVEDQLDEQYHNDFSPKNVQTFKILDSFGQKMRKIKNCHFLPFHKNFNNFTE